MSTMGEGMVLRLRPGQGGSYTHLPLSGVVGSAPLGPVLRQVVRIFSPWSGWPVHVVLHVDRQRAGWCEVWTGALGAVPARQFTAQVQAPRPGEERR